jgi:hypothetical protein
MSADQALGRGRSRKPKVIKLKRVKATIKIKRPGAFRAKAQKAGKTTRQYAQEKAHAPGLLGKQARLAKTLMGFKK